MDFWGGGGRAKGGKAGNQPTWWVSLGAKASLHMRRAVEQHPRQLSLIEFGGRGKYGVGGLWCRLVLANYITLIWGSSGCGEKREQREQETGPKPRACGGAV